MFDKDIYSKAMVNILDERLKFNNLKYKVILYSSSLGYEYNYKTKRIRPINSVFWFNILKAEAPTFLSFFTNIIDDIIDQAEESGWVTSCFGECDHRNITIDMDSINPKNIASVINDEKYVKSIWDSYYDFCLYITKIYNDADKEIKKNLDAIDFSNIAK